MLLWSTCGLLALLGRPAEGRRLATAAGLGGGALVQEDQQVDQAPVEPKVSLPSAQCTWHLTKPTADAPGSWSGLVGQDAICPDGTALGGWQVVAGNLVSKVVAVQVNYTCCAYSSPLRNCEDQRRPLAATGSVLAGLQGVEATCAGGSKVLTGWRVVSTASGGELAFRCCALAERDALTACQDMTTPALRVGNGGAAALVNHQPACRANELLQSWSLVSNVSGTQAIQHRCCAVGSALPLGRTGSCFFWGDPHFRPFDQVTPVTRWVDMLQSGRFWVVKSRYVLIEGEYCGWASVNGGVKSRCEGSPSLTRGLAVGGPFLHGRVLVVQPMSGGVFWAGKRIDPTGVADWRVNEPGVVALQARGAQLTVELPLGVQLAVVRRAQYIDTTITMRQLPGGQDGHCGNFDGNATDDQHAEVLRRAASFVVPPNEDLFGAEQGEARTAGALAPRRFVCEGQALAWATAACQQRMPNATEVDRAWQQLCIFDTCELGSLAVADAAAADRVAVQVSIRAEAPQPYRPLPVAVPAAGADPFGGSTPCTPKSRQELAAVWQVAAANRSGASAVLGARWQQGAWTWVDNTVVDTTALGSGRIANGTDGAWLCAGPALLLGPCAAGQPAVPVAQPRTRDYAVGALADPVQARASSCPAGQRLAMPKVAADLQRLAAAARQSPTRLALVGGRFTQGQWRWDDGTAVAADGVEAPPAPLGSEAFLCLGMEDGRLRSCGADGAQSFTALCETTFQGPTCPPGPNNQSGVPFGGRCFYLGAEGASCDSTCEQVPSGWCDDAGLALAGETLSTCRFVTDAFGSLRYSPAASVVNTDPRDAGSGCTYSALTRAVSLMQPGGRAGSTCAAVPFGAGQRRVCACGSGPTPSAVAAAVVAKQASDEVRKVSAEVGRVLAQSGATICGGSAIRQFLTAPRSADEVRNIPWSQVDAVAEEYLRTQGAEVQRLAVEVQRLAALIPERERQERPAPLSADDVRASVQAAMQNRASFGTISVAAASKCGAVLAQPRPPKGAYQAAVATFGPIIRQRLQDGSRSVHSQTFSDTCLALFYSTRGEINSNCGELCQAFADVAQAASDQYAGALAVNGRSADQLRQDLERVQGALRTAMGELEGCRRAKADIDVFKAQLTTLGRDVVAKHASLMEARDALMDAQYDLDDAQAGVEDQRAALQRATEVLKSAGAVAEAALAQFTAAGQRTDALRAVLQSAQSELAGAQARLKAVQGANDVVAQLKAAVSDAMLKMVLFFEEAVRKPVRELGLGEDKQVDRLFPQLLSQLSSARCTRYSLEALNAFCSLNSTQQALAAGASGSMDPRDLCKTGSVPDVQKDVEDSVAATVSSIKDALREVQSWLDPYRGQSAEDRAAVAANIAKGEPVGLREVLSTFGSTTFYRSYLQQWQLKGRFLEILAALQKSLEQSQLAHYQATNRLTAAQTELAQSEKALASARAALQQAMASRTLAEAQQKEATAVLASLDAVAARMAKKSEDLVKARDEALRLWQAAQRALEQTHKEGTALVELLEALEAAEVAEA